MSTSATSPPSATGRSSASGRSSATGQSSASGPATLPFAAAPKIAGDVALDLGTTAFRSLRREGGQLVGRREAAAYVVLPRRPEPQRLLQDAGIAFSRCESGLIVAGQAAVAVAASFQTPLIPLVPGGELPTGDPIGRQVAAILLESVLGPRESLRGKLCVMTVPGSPGVSESSPTLLFFTQLVSLAGLTPQVVHAGSAAAAAAFSDRGLRGLGISIGASHIDLGLIAGGFETAWHRVPIGGDTIDSRLIQHHAAYVHDRHGDRYPDFLAIRQWKEAADRSLLATDPASRTLAEGYGDVVLSGVRAAADLLPAADTVPCVVTGGPTAVTGFEPLWLQAVRSHGLDGRFSEMRIETDAEYEVARGLLLLTEAGSRRMAA